jgi:hypothetical protein
MTKLNTAQVDLTNAANNGWQLQNHGNLKIATKTITVSVAMTQAWGTAYFGTCAASNWGSLPTGFTPITSIVQEKTGLAWVTLNAANPPEVCCIRPGSATNNLKLTCTIIGY